MTPESARMMAAYAHWMNTRMFANCATLSESDRRRDLGAFFGSLQATLDHLVWGDWMWVARFDGGERPPTGLGVPLAERWDDLSAQRERIDRRIMDWAGGVSEAWLAAPFSWTSGVDGRRNTHPGWLLATHMFNHGTHHRGQATTLMRQLGVDPGVTDLPVVARHLAQETGRPIGYP